MYELMQVTERDRYIVSPAKAGLVITGEGEAVLIDSGSDESAGRKIRQILERVSVLLYQPLFISFVLLSVDPNPPFLMAVILSPSTVRYLVNIP